VNRFKTGKEKGIKLVEESRLEFDEKEKKGAFCQQVYRGGKDREDYCCFSEDKKGVAGEREGHKKLPRQRASGSIILREEGSHAAAKNTDGGDREENPRLQKTKETEKRRGPLQQGNLLGGDTLSGGTANPLT